MKPQDLSLTKMLSSYLRLYQQQQQRSFCQLQKHSALLHDGRLWGRGALLATKAPPVSSELYQQHRRHHQQHRHQRHYEYARQQNHQQQQQQLQQQRQQPQLRSTLPLLQYFLQRSEQRFKPTSSVLPSSTCSTSLAIPLILPYRCYSKFTCATESPMLGSQPLCEERAQDLVSNLKDSERAAIKLALEKYDAMKVKKGFEGKLAATQWRTRFGRLSKVPALGEVDPTGSFCAFPDDWLKKKAAEKAKEPTSSDLWKIFFVNAVPFVGFGFLDNFTMIIAGDYIEHIFGTFMCISTMAAAGLGNTISDVLGIGSAFYVERACEFMGLRPPDLTPIQMEMKSSRRSANYGRIIGITVGCLVGMFPLLFMDKKPSEEPADKKLPTN